MAANPTPNPSIYSYLSMVLILIVIIGAYTGMYSLLQYIIANSKMSIKINIKISNFFL